MLDTVANFIVSIIGICIIVWTILAVTESYGKEAEMNDRRDKNDFIK